MPSFPQSYRPSGPSKTWLAYKCFVPQCGANVWRVDRRADARGHPGSRPKSTMAICRGGGGASPKCLEVNCGAAGLWALIRDEWMREQASTSALRERSQDSYGGEGAKMREADLLAGEHSGASSEPKSHIFSWGVNIGLTFIRFPVTQLQINVDLSNMSGNNISKCVTF